MTGMQEVLVIIVIGLVLFNWRKLPDFAGSIGKALTSFKQGMAEPEKPAEGQADGQADNQAAGQAEAAAQPAAQAPKPEGQDAPPKA